MNDPSESALHLDERWSFHGFTMDWFIEKAAWIGRESRKPGSADYFFSTAGRLLKYCAADYMLLSPMCFHAIIGLEARLRFCFNTGSEGSFSELLRRAVHEKLVTDEVFSSPKPLPKNFLARLKELDEPLPITHAGKLAVLLPKLRNDYFHGVFLLCPELLYLAIEAREVADALTEAQISRQ